MRAAHAALILGIVGGLWLASSAFSARATPAPMTVAAALALDEDGLDIDARRSEAVAVLVARCMQGRGFVWKPWVEPPPTVPDADLEPVAWAERWGFGVSTFAGRLPEAQAQDPNLTALAGLPLADRTRYRNALYGTRESDPGCLRSGNDAVFGLRDRLLTPLRAALADLDARINADPGALDAVAAWRACVAPIAGNDLPERRSFAERLIARFDGQVQGLGATPASMVGLFALQTEERRVAAILAGCEAAFARTRDAVATPFEAAFVAQHRDGLARIGAAIRDAEAALPTLPP